MAKETQIEKTIPKLYKRNALNLMMFAFVRGVRATLHTITISNAIRMFMENMELSGEEYDSESARSTFHLLQKELINLKSINND